MDFVHLFTKLSGRINRAKYWGAAIICAVLYLLLLAGVYLIGQNSVMQIVNTAASIVLALVMFGVSINRLHDRNKSGWYALLFLAGPAALVAVSLAVGSKPGQTEIAATVLTSLALIIGVWSFVELGCLRGSIGQNQYGPDPLAPEVLTPPVRTHA